MGENTSQNNPNETKCMSLSLSSANLKKKLKTLQKDYQNFTKTSSKTMKSQESHKKCNSFVQVLEFDTSPRNLMSALQHPTTRRRSLSFSYCSPSIVTQSSGEVWRVRENELAKEEIRRDRKLAFESGKLRGRRLFEGESELSYEEEDDDDDEYDVYSVCVEKNVEVEEVVKEVNEESKQIRMIKLGDDVTCLAYGKKMLIILALMGLVIGIGIILLGGFDGHASDLKVVIPPT